MVKATNLSNMINIINVSSQHSALSTSTSTHANTISTRTQFCNTAMGSYSAFAPVQCPRCHVPSGLNCWWGICHTCHEHIWMINLQKDLIPHKIRIGRIQVDIVSFLIDSDKRR